MDGLNNFQQMVLKELSDIKSTSARTEQQVADLAGPFGRVTMIEKRLDTADQRTWIKVAVMGPIIFVVHAALRKFGVQI